MNSAAQEYINKQKQISEDRKLKEREEFLEEIGLRERVYSDNTEYTDEFPLKDKDDTSEHFGKQYTTVTPSLSDEEYEEVLKAYKLNNEIKNSTDTVAYTLKMLAIFIYVIGGLFALVSFTSGTFAGILTLLSIFITGTSFLGFSRIIDLLNDIKNK